MSYCRFSSDDWQCDVYVWADVGGGWSTEVAACRWIFDDLPEPVELPHPFTDAQFNAWLERYRRVLEMHGDESCGHWLPLPAPEGGRSYRHGTPAECADNLVRLRAAGFHVPQNAIEALRGESDA